MTYSVLQPYFVLSSDKYYKAVMNNFGISHFYTFKKDISTASDTIAVPDGCIDVLFTCSESAPTAEICGSVLKPVNAIEGTENYFGVRFFPGEFSINNKVHIKEIINNRVFLNDIFETDHINERILAADFKSQINIFLDFYLTLLSKNECPSESDKLKAYMLNCIYSSKGQMKVKELASEIGYSERHTNTKFTDFFGISPKYFSKIVRFQNLISELNSYNNYSNNNPDISLTDLSQNAGYFDQSHMYKDFNELSSSSPCQYLNLLSQKNYKKRLVVV